jgi:hypothetical protein
MVGFSSGLFDPLFYGYGSAECLADIIDNPDDIIFAYLIINAQKALLKS